MCKGGRERVREETKEVKNPNKKKKRSRRCNRWRKGQRKEEEGEVKKWR